MESAGDFPFRNIRKNVYLLLEVMMYVEYKDAYKFMFNINKEGREFLINKFTTVRNGFINDGLIDLCSYSSFNFYDYLEKQYF